MEYEDVLCAERYVWTMAWHVDHRPPDHGLWIVVRETIARILLVVSFLVIIKHLVWRADGSSVASLAQPLCLVLAAKIPCSHSSRSVRCVPECQLSDTAHLVTL